MPRSSLWPRLRTIALAVAVLAIANVAAVAQPLELELAGHERILAYDSRIEVADDGALTVRETITVEAHNVDIVHGIYRDFPTSYRGPWLTRLEVPFELLAVERNGEPEPYRSERQDDGVRVYAGAADRTVPPGIHTYVFSYRTDRQLGFFAEHDELYWNVTGNFWSFPIESARAVVKLPAVIPRRFVSHEGYTGYRGSRERGLESRLDPYTGEAHFATTRPLAASEGLTIVVGFPKGYVEPPDRAEKIAGFVASNRHLLAGALGVIVVLAYYLLAWVLVGRDPRAGTIIPRFAPPLDLPPACVRFVREMRYDSRCFTAAIVDMAVKGALRIDDSAKHYVIERLDGEPKAPLSAGERRIAEHLLKSERLELKSSASTAEKMQKAVKGLRQLLRLEYEGKMFVVNRAWMIGGLALTGLMVAATVLAGPLASAAGFVFIMVWLSVWTVAVAALISAAVGAWRAVLGRRRGVFERVGAGGSAVVATLFAIPFLGGEVLGLFFLAQFTSIWMIPVLLALIGLNVLFFQLLKRPTRSGRQVMDEVDGFKMYLQTAEQETIARMGPPELTAELFESYLPYAIALDVENEWSERFEAVLKASGRTPSEYRPGWYSGSSWHDLGATGFASAVGSSMSSAFSSAATAPGSSSGGGGGGSSGGGGGGGGGGGW